jgi:hypothetical protein
MIHQHQHQVQDSFNYSHFFMKSLLTRAVLASTTVGTALAGTAAHAQSGASNPNPFGSSGKAAGELRNAGNSAGITSQQNLPQIIGTIINVVLGFMGIVLLFYVILAGWEWMSAGGDDKGVTTAKTRIKNAVIGLVIIVSAYAISNFVISQLANLTQ